MFAETCKQNSTIQIQISRRLVTGYLNTSNVFKIVAMGE